MKNENLNMNLSNWIEEQQARGKRAFSLRQIDKDFPSISDIAIKRSLTRLSRKNKVVSIHKGYYLVIPPQYAAKGILPPAIFIDGLMKFLERPYYVGLASAAAFHGAAHQQPQEFFVFTTFPTLRSTTKKGIKINYISKKILPPHLIQDVKTESGYLKVSSPSLTAVDLIQFEKRVGGMNRVATILNELAETIEPDSFPRLVAEMPTAGIQRLGYLLDSLEYTALADQLFDVCLEKKCDFFRIPLKSSVSIKGYSSDNRWKVIVNMDIEIDE